MEVLCLRKKIQDSKDDSIIIDTDNSTIIQLQLFDLVKNRKILYYSCIKESNFHSNKYAF